LASARTGLFAADADARADLRTLATHVEAALRETSADAAAAHLACAMDGAPWRMVPFLRTRVLPPVALELAAAAAGLASSDPRVVRAVWDAHEALRMGAAPILTDDQPATGAENLPILVRKLEQFQAPPDVAAKTIAQSLARDEARLSALRAAIAEHRDKLAEELARGEDELTARSHHEGQIEEQLREASRYTSQPLGPPAGEAMERAGQRVLAIGAFGDGSWARFPNDRPMLSLEREQFITAEGLTLAVDCALGGSHDALEKLDTFADANAGRAWAHWLHEMACVASGDPKLARRREALDACVEHDPLAKDLVREARARIAGHDTTHFEDAWLMQSGARPGHEIPPPTFPTLEDPLAQELFNEISDRLATLPNVVDELYGPFPILAEETPHAVEVLMPAAQALLAGNRRLLGLDLAREALPRAIAWLDHPPPEPRPPTVPPPAAAKEPKLPLPSTGEGRGEG
jgi:hypothetical protein